MIDGFRFAPDAFHAAACGRAMHLGLADSLRQICEASAGKVAFDHGAIQRVIRDIENGHRFSPNAFAIYYELVPALLEGWLDTARDLFFELTQQKPSAAPLYVLALGDPALRDREARYLRFMNDDGSFTHRFVPPSPQDLAAFERQFANAMILLDRAAPELAGELRALISELILVMGQPDAKVQFDGGSSYQLWGALFLNATRHQTRIDVIEALAHESAHTRLFSLCIEEAAVRNADDERHASPLRHEPRPMDGVYHATFVSARMHWAMARLIASGLLSDEEMAQATHARDEDRRNFERGYETISAHARLTDTGRKAMEAARAYMSEAA